MKRLVFSAAMLGLVACGGTQTNNNHNNNTQTAPARPRFALARMLFENPGHSEKLLFTNLTLDEAGVVKLDERVVARFAGQRLLNNDNFELCTFDDNTVTVPWKPELNLRIRDDGSLENRNGGTLTINDQGVIVTGGRSAMSNEERPTEELPGRVVDFKPEQRLTAELLFIAYSLEIMHAVQVLEEYRASHPPALPAQLRFLHLLSDPAATHLQVTLPNRTQDGGNALVAFPDFAYGSRTGFYALSPGSELVDFSVGSAAPLVHASTIELASEKSYLGIVHATSGSDPTPMLTTVEEAAAPTVPEGKIMAQWFNAITGTTSVDLCVPGARRRDPASPVFQTVNSGAWAALEGNDQAFATLTPSASGVKLELHATDTARGACKGAVLGTLSLGADASNHAYSLFSMGQVGGAAALQVLACPSGAEACTVVPVQLPAARRAR